MEAQQDLPDSDMQLAAFRNDSDQELPHFKESVAKGGDRVERVQELIDRVD